MQAIGLGLFAGVFGVVYLLGVEFLTELIWGEEPVETGWFSGDLEVVLIPIVFGLVVGLIYRIFKLPPRFPSFIEDLQEGVVEPKTAPGVLGIAFLSLISGPSLGPEGPMATAGGAAGTWLARRRGLEKEGVSRLTFVGVSGAFGGLLSTPIGGPLLAFELEHDQTNAYYYLNIVPGVIAGSVSFGVMYPVLGAPFKGLLTMPPVEFGSWMLLAAVGLGCVGALAALVVGKVLVASVSLFRPLDERPVVRGLVGGALVALIGFVMPLTLFSGQTTLPVILDNWDVIGVVTLLVLALLKAVALGASLGGGFYGGPIFPMFFIGGTIGVAVHALIPEIPLGLAVGATMAALGAAVALLPLSMAVITAIMIQSGLEAFGAVALASITAYAIRLAISRSRQGDLQRSAKRPPEFVG
jgi:H+/Cl- antiporter ClcA